MKETGTDHWNSPNTGVTNESGFTARGSGIRLYNKETYRNLKQYFYAWTVTLSGSNPYYNRLTNNNSTVLKSFASKKYGFSVRCLED